MSSRSLLSVNFPKELLTTLTRNGYETVQDVIATDPNMLAKGNIWIQSWIWFNSNTRTDLGITLQQVDDILNRCGNIQTPAASLHMTQSAALRLQQSGSQRVQTGCAALDALLDGGLSRGHILEISGPPGSPKEKLVVKIASIFAEAGEDVLFVGKNLYIVSQRVCITMTV